MKPDATHIKQIKVVSNTHWDREFRRSFEKTRHSLLRMMDTTLEILETDPAYHSFTLDGHSILVDDYLEIRPEKRELVTQLIREGRLIIGPWYTLVEQFSIGQEALVRNLIWGRKLGEKYGARPGTVAYTPASWGQTGQLPQILKNFGLDKMMFYRGISHHEADAEYIWQAPDGTQVLASRFAVYARYNWYYQVHRAVTRRRVFDKDYQWGEFDEIPVRLADSLGDRDPAFELKAPALAYDPSQLKTAIEKMVEAEGTHFTTDIFLAMHGHDISVAHPLESQIIRDARTQLAGQYTIEHTDLEAYWQELVARLDYSQLPVLTGERRAYLKKGMWTYLFPNTISARTYLKQQDFTATQHLVYQAEPLASMACLLGAPSPTRYLERGWHYLLANHTHDANGGCAPDAVCLDMEYRYRKVNDIAEIISADAMSYVAQNLSPENMESDAVQLIVFNSLPFLRDALITLDFELPQIIGTSFALTSQNDPKVPLEIMSAENSSVFIDNIWDVPTILNSTRVKGYGYFKNLPALGYRVYHIQPVKTTPQVSVKSIVRDSQMLENEYLQVTINENGTVNIIDKINKTSFKNLNYLSDEGETGNAWQHKSPKFDRKIDNRKITASKKIMTNSPLVGTIGVAYLFPVPVDYADGDSRNEQLIDLPVSVEYRLETGQKYLKVTLTVDNRAKDHWLRVNFPTELKTNSSWADSHFDVVERVIPLPDGTGWVEPPRGTHPLQTFVDLFDGQKGLAIFTKGIFEYEAFEDEPRTLALTLIRACRIKLAVSEEKQTELTDQGIQCPGEQRFEYAIFPHTGSKSQVKLLNLATEYLTPVRALMAGRGKGHFPSEMPLLELDNLNLHITAIKPAEDGAGLIIRLFNPLPTKQKFSLTIQTGCKAMMLCNMDEMPLEPLPATSNILKYSIQPKKIMTILVY